MALGNLAGRARVDPTHPQGQAECDNCGIWYQHHQLRKQMKWGGVQLFWTGSLVCPTCLDEPQQQDKTVILPLDPKPLVNPRPSANITPISAVGQPIPTSPENTGFTQYVINAAVSPLYPGDKTDMLADLAEISGVPLPSGMLDWSIASGVQNVPSIPLPFNVARTWLVIYNPTPAPWQITLGNSIAFGTSGNLAIGPGEAYFWATSQGLSPVWTGMLSAVGLYPGSPLWILDAPNLGFWNNSGVLDLLNTTGWPTDSFGLEAGAVWSNSGDVNVVGPTSYSGTPLFFGQLSSAQVLAQGLIGLPSVAPTPGSWQLWNDNGVVAIA